MNFSDPRMESASRTNQSGGRGWCFAPEPEVSFSERLVFNVLKPSSLIVFAVVAAVVAVWWV